MIQINLVPDVKQEFLRAQKLRNMAVSISVIVGLAAAGVVVVLGLLLGAQLLHEKIQKENIDKQFKKLSSIEDLSSLLTIQSQLAAIPDLQSNRSMMSRAFDTVTAITPTGENEIKISNLTIDPTESTMTIEGSANNGYSATDVFRKTILNTQVKYKSGDTEQTVPLATKVDMGQTSYGEDVSGQRVLRFKLSFAYPAELLNNKGTLVSLVSPTGQKDVTDSKQQVPDAIFSQKAKDIEGEK